MRHVLTMTTWNWYVGGRWLPVSDVYRTRANNVVRGATGDRIGIPASSRRPPRQPRFEGQSLAVNVAMVGVR